MSGNEAAVKIVSAVCTTVFFIAIFAPEVLKRRPK